MSVRDRIPEYLRSNGPSVPLCAARSLLHLLDLATEEVCEDTDGQHRDGVSLILTLAGDLIEYAQEQIIAADNRAAIHEAVKEAVEGQYSPLLADLARRGIDEAARKARTPKGRG